MNPREEWRVFYGVVRRRSNAEEDGPGHYFSGLPKKWAAPIQYALWGPRDVLEDRRPNHILRMLKEKRDPWSWRNRAQFNCRCSMRPIIVDDKTGS